MAGVLDLSPGPTLAKAEQGVHIIFVPPEVALDPGPDAKPSQHDLDRIAAALPNAVATDVIVFAGRPWHKVKDHLRKHPEVHKDFKQTVLKLLIERGETAVWWSEQEFAIHDIKLETHEHGSGATAHPPGTTLPSSPFQNLPKTEHVKDIDNNPDRIYVARSEVPSEAAEGLEYKITIRRITINGDSLIDPNMKCI
jgi:hypothetical protein